MCKMGNHFKNHQIYSTKNGLLDTVNIVHGHQQQMVFNIMPLSFKIKYHPGKGIKGLKQFRQIYDAIQSEEKAKLLDSKNKQLFDTLTPTLNSKNPNGNVWILKPTHLNRGRGISLFNSIESLVQKVKNPEIDFSQAKTATKVENFSSVNRKITQQKKTYRVNHKDMITSSFLNKSKTVSKNSSQVDHYIIQKYIERPILYWNRKFDLRCWVLVTHRMDFYYYPAIYVRLSGPEFNPDLTDIDDKYAHLTNNAIQKNGATYNSLVEGNIIPVSRLFYYLDEEIKQTNPDKPVNTEDVVIPQIKHILKKIMKKQAGRLNPRNNSGSFELFGFDFMIDAELKVWLIEGNTNPCLEESNSYMSRLIPRMINDTLKLTMDLVFTVPDDKKLLGSSKRRKNGSKQAKKSNRKVENESNTVLIAEDEHKSDKKNEDTVHKLSDKSYSSDKQASSKELVKEKYPLEGYEDGINLWQQLGNMKVPALRKKLKQPQ